MDILLYELRLLKAMGRGNYVAMCVGYPSEYPSWNAYVKAKRSCLGEIPARCFGMCPQEAQELMDGTDLSGMNFVITTSNNYPILSCTNIEDVEKYVLGSSSHNQSDIQAYHLFASRSSDEMLTLIGTLINYNGTLIES